MFVAAAALFGLWFGLVHVKIPQHILVGLEVIGCNIIRETDATI